MKNSSRLEKVMARNLSRSSSGQCGSATSSRTRRLNASHDSSRFRYSDGSLGVGRAPEVLGSGWVILGLSHNRTAGGFQ